MKKSRGINHGKNKEYIILLLVTYTGILKIKYMFKKNKKYFREQKSEQIEES